MFLASDNSGPAHPKVLDAVAAANSGHVAAYGNDPLTRAVQDRIRTIFEAPEAVVHLVATGTAANSLILATMARPWDAIFCTPMAHIAVDECNGPEFYTGGAKLALVDGPDGRMKPQALQTAIAATGQSVHSPQTGPLSLTQVTETGTVYDLAALRRLTSIAHRAGIKTHLDGARFANALAALGCTPAEMTWKAGIDAVSFGGTKNGCLGVEACVIFDPDLGWEFELRRKRAGHLFSKNRFLAAQMLGYLEADLWLDMARTANDSAARLATELQRKAEVEILYPVDANMIFARYPRHLHQRLLAAGAVYNVMDGDPADGDPDAPLIGRFVCDWSLGVDAVDRFLSLF